jgi:alkylated DNA repair dioxygenase AlkB
MIDEKPTPLPVSDAQLLLFPRLDLGEDDRVLLWQLIDHTPWRQDDITLFGKTHRQPRLVAWYGDPGASYTYSGIRHEPLPWTSTLQQLRQRVQAAAGAELLPR